MVVVAPFALPRLGLVRLMESIQGVEVVAHCGDVADALKISEELHPDVALIDAELAVDDEMTLIVALKSAVPLARIVMLADRASSTQVERALESGADAFTLKDITLTELESTIRRVVAGDTVLHPDAASVIARRLAANGKEKAHSLTPRQREILRLLAMGLENKQIARRLGIGVHTVKTHVSRVLSKLDASSRTEAVVVAMRDRLIS